MSDENTQVVVDTATRAATPSELTPLEAVESLYSVVVPEDSSLEIIDVEAYVAPYRDRPRRKKGTTTLTTAASLSQLVNDHQADGTELYADWRARRIVAVFNDHHGGENGGPGWGDHRAVLALTHTPEWEKWLSRDGRLGSQVEFAEHIEDCSPTIMDPPAADLLELAQTFHANTAVEFKSQNRLSDGQVQLRYEETISARAGQSGQITIPLGFLLRFAVFDGSEPIEVGARLRYRLRDGKLSIGYVLDGIDTVVREAVERVVNEVERATTLTALRGTPRTA